jgi:hypothetical protein
MRNKHQKKHQERHFKNKELENLTRKTISKAERKGFLR